MEQFTVEINAREEKGSAANRRVRLQGLLPGVVYASGEGSFSITTPMKEFVLAASKATSSQVFTLKSGITKLNGRPAIVKEVQVDRQANKVTHVDFQVLRDDQEITIRVPLRFTGESIGVKEDGGILSVSAHDLLVVCFPRSIPSELVVEISPLRIGDSIHANELKLPEGVSLAGNPGETIVSIVVVKQIVEAVAAPVEGAAPAEGAAAAAPAEGAAAAPAAEGDAKKEAAPAKGGDKKK